METIRDPRVPYIGEIVGGRFTPGKIIRIQGSTSAAAYRFSIYLQCGPNVLPRDDVALQITVRILEGHVKLNSLHNGVWGEEQLEVLRPIGFGDEFEIKLICTSRQYKVVINDQHRFDFPQRIHCNRITHLAIDGDVSLVQISALTDDNIEGISRNRIGQPPIVLHSMGAQNNDFDMIDSTRSVRSDVLDALPPAYEEAIFRCTTGLRPVDPLPPSYEEAVCDNQEADISFPAGDPPYPTDAPYPTGMPHRTDPSGPTISLLPGVQNVDGSEIMDMEDSTSSRDPPYPTGDPYATGMPRPTRPFGASTDLFPAVPNAYALEVTDTSRTSSRTLEESPPREETVVPIPLYADSSTSLDTTSSRKKKKKKKWTLIAIIFAGIMIGIFLGTRHSNHRKL